MANKYKSNGMVVAVGQAFRGLCDTFFVNMPSSAASQLGKPLEACATWKQNIGFVLDCRSWASL